jgi:hypothetical protein
LKEWLNPNNGSRVIQTPVTLILRVAEPPRQGRWEDYTTPLHFFFFCYFFLYIVLYFWGEFRNFKSELVCMSRVALSTHFTPNANKECNLQRSENLRSQVSFSKIWWSKCKCGVSLGVKSNFC